MIADIGSGTGIWTQKLLDAGYSVHAIEPNKDMRETAENSLKNYPNFISIEGTAESTTLPTGSMDIITVAQALHWFNLDPTRIEFQRILKPAGWLIIIYNRWKGSDNQFLRGYENIISKYGKDYRKINDTQIDQKRIQKFYGSDKFYKKYFPNLQLFNFEGLKGRLLSSSYIPLENDLQFEQMIADLQCLFDEFQQDNYVEFKYKTEVYYGQPKFE
jgi:ubiquinone/menaquinone biosynthesis C-methylase UbiE